MHKWISTDGGDQCYRCGIALDFGARTDDGGTIDYDDPRTETEAEAARLLAPFCTGPSTERAHHYILEARSHEQHEPRQRPAWRLACAYGDATITPHTDTAAATYQAECVGA